MAELQPYLEQTAIYNHMDLTQPMYDPTNGYNISTANQFAVQQIVKLFLCPSDVGEFRGRGLWRPALGPTNYAVCVGDGLSPARRLAARGQRRHCSRPRTAPDFTDVSDGLSNTAMLSGKHPRRRPGGRRPARLAQSTNRLCLHRIWRPSKRFRL